MKMITVQAKPGRSVPLSASCNRPDNGPRILTDAQGPVELELRDLVAVQYIRSRVRVGDLIEVKAPSAAIAAPPAAAASTSTSTGRRD